MTFENKLKATLLGIVIFTGVHAQNGESLFKANCKACHSDTKLRLVGPGLGDVRSRRDDAWLLKWIKDPMAMVNSGDADANAVYQEYNKSPMPPFLHLSDAEIKSIIDYLPAGNTSSGQTDEQVEEELVPIEYTSEDVEEGKKLFEGSQRLTNNGPACISCHNVSNDDLIGGGLLAKDLTHTYATMGDAGIGGILSAPPFPAMVNSYSSNPLTEDEILKLTGFLKHADGVTSPQEDKTGVSMMVKYGILGLIVWIFCITIIWNKRKKDSVKKDIFARQSKGNDSVES